MDDLDELLALAKAVREDDDGDAPAPHPPLAFPPGRVHWTNLRSMARSPAHFRTSAMTAFAPTSAMRMGLAVHSLILGGDEVVRFGAEARRGRAWADFEEGNAGKIILTAPEHDRAFAIAHKVRTHPIAAPVLVGEHERRLEWDWLGRACAGRLDVLGNDWIAEVKVTANAEPSWFARHATRSMHYHGQLAWYRQAARANGIWPSKLYIVAVEYREPFAVTVFRLTAEAVEAGEMCARAWMERLLVCERANEWPEYSQSVVDLHVEPELELDFGDVDDDAA